MMAMHWACRITLDEDAIDAAQDDQEQAMGQIEAFRATKLPESSTIDDAKLFDPAIVKDALFDINLVNQLVDRARQRIGALASQLLPKPKVTPKQTTLAAQVAGLELD